MGDHPGRGEQVMAGPFLPARLQPVIERLRTNHEPATTFRDQPGTVLPVIHQLGDEIGDQQSQPLEGGNGCRTGFTVALTHISLDHFQITGDRVEVYAHAGASIPASWMPSNTFRSTCA